MPIPVDLDTPEEQERKMWERAAPGSVVDPIYAQISREAYQRASRTPGWNGILLDAVGYMAMLMSKGADATKAKRNFDASISIRGKQAPAGLADKALAAVATRYKQLEGARQASGPANQMTVRRWMNTNWRQHVDRNTGEGGATELAEAAAYEFEHPDWLDDSDHWVWDLAAEVMSKQAPQRLAADRSALIRKAASMPPHSPQRRRLLALITKKK